MNTPRTSPFGKPQPAPSADSTKVNGYMNGHAPTVRLLSPELDRLRRDWLEGKGWDDSVLLVNQMTFCPNLPAEGVEPIWHPRFQSQLRGHPYRSIPYFDLNGEPLLRHIPLAGRVMPFVRARLLNYKEKKGKYQSYAGGGVAIYACRQQANWSEIAADASIPVALTEGEDKSIAGCLNGMPTLGISGVDCLVSNGVIAEPCGPDVFIWKDRTVLIVFDQDEESTYDKPWKPGVAAGADRCASHLIAAGAVPVFVYIARTEVGKERLGQKLGLDDYFKAGGTVDELISEQCTRRADQDNILAQLLLRYGMTDKGDVLDAETGGLLNYGKLKLVYAAHFTIQKINGNKRKVYAMDRWLDHPSRVIVPHDGIVLDPTLPTGFVEGCKYNQWQGFVTAPAAVPNPVAVAAFETLGSRLWNESWPWVRGYYAHLMQRPGDKAVQSLVLRSKVEGIGKSLQCEIIQETIGPAHAVKIQPDKLFHKFGTHVRGNVFGFCDELQSDYTRHEDTLKDLITADTWEVEDKGVNIQRVPNRMRLVINTNRAYATKMGENARRQLVQVPSVSEADKANGWQDWVRSVAVRLKTDPEWRASVLAYLLSVDLSACGYAPDMDAPWTIHRAAMAAAGDSPQDMEAKRLFDSLPDRFALTADMNTVVWDGKANKNIMDLVRASATYTAYGQVKADGKVLTLNVYSKSEPLPVRTMERTDSASVRARVDLPAEEVRAILKATQEVLVGRMKF